VLGADRIPGLPVVALGYGPVARRSAGWVLRRATRRLWPRQPTSLAPDFGDRGPVFWIVLVVVLVLVLGSTPDDSAGSTRSDRSSSPVVEI